MLVQRILMTGKSRPTEFPARGKRAHPATAPRLDPATSVRDQPVTRQYAEQCGGHGRDRRKEPFVVAEAVIARIDLSRKVVPIEVARQARFHRQVTRSLTRGGNIHQDGPVADQNRQKQDHLRAHFRQQKDQRRDAVADCDPLQDARVALDLKPELQPLLDEPQQEQQDHSARNSEEGRALWLITRLILPQRERQDDADQEEKQRKDQIVKPEAFPFHVLELLGELAGLRRVQPFSEGPASRSPPTIQNMSNPRRALIERAGRSDVGGRGCGFRSLSGVPSGLRVSWIGTAGIESPYIEDRTVLSVEREPPREERRTRRSR